MSFVRASILLALLAAAVFAVYAQTAHHSFHVRDDGVYIYNNERMSRDGLLHLPHIWTHHHRGLYIPVTMTTWTAIAQFSGTRYDPELSDKRVISPTGYHLANVTLHAGSTILLTWILYLLIDRRSFLAAALGAALFAVHPLLVESVAWVSGMKDTLSTFAALGSLLFYLLFSRNLVLRKSITGLFCYPIAFACFAIAVLAKPTPLVLPAVFVLLDVLVIRVPWWRSLLRVLPFAALSITVAFLTIDAGEQAGSVTEFTPPPPALRPVVALDAIAFYLSKLVYPLDLAVDYGRTPEKALSTAWQRPFWVVPILLLIGIILVPSPARRHYLAGAGVMFLGLLPVLGLQAFAYQDQSTVADRYFYFAMVGIAIAVAAWISRAGPMARPEEDSPPPADAAAAPPDEEPAAPPSPGKPGTLSAWRAALVCAVLPVLGWLAWHQTHLWRRSSTILEHTLRVNPASASSTYNLAAIALTRGDEAAAIDGFRKTIEIEPELELPYLNLGYLHLGKGNHDEAIPMLVKAVELTPGNVNAHVQLGGCYLTRGDSKRSIPHLRKALELDPGNGGVAVNLAIAYASEGDRESAEKMFAEAARFDPASPEPHLNAGAYYMRDHRHDEAVRSFRRLVAIQPENPEAYSLLGRALAAQGNFPEAAEVAGKGLALAGQNPSYPAEKRQVLERCLRNFRKGLPY